MAAEPDGGRKGGEAGDGAWQSHSWALLVLGGLCAVKLAGWRETIMCSVEEILRQKQACGNEINGGGGAGRGRREFPWYSRPWLL